MTLMLVAIPTHLRSLTAGLVECKRATLQESVCLPTWGSSERSMLLSQLVSPDVMKSCAGAVSALRKWQQSFNRVKELHAVLFVA